MNGMKGRLRQRLAAMVTAAFLAAGPLQAGAASLAQTSGGSATPTPTPAAAATPAATPAPATGGQSSAAKPAAVPPIAPQGYATVRSVPAGYDKTSENATLALYVDKKTGQIAVLDKRSGLVWLSNPHQAAAPSASQSAQSSAASSASAQESAAVYFMQYTDYQRQVVKLLNSAWDSTPPVVSALPDGGTRVVFDPKQALQTGPIAFAMDYHLHDGYFDVTIPVDQIKEHIDNKGQTGSYLVTLEPLPFFGAGADDEQGYMLVPDGSGALIRFKKVHPDYLQPFTQEVYSPDIGTPGSATVGSIANPTASSEPVMLPAFGIAKQADAAGKPLDGGFLGLVLKGQGDADVSMDVDPSGYITRYNHAGAEFLYRRTAEFPRSRGSRVSRVAPDLIGGDRTVRYYLLNGSAASYVGMAAKYRDYLKNDLHIPLLAKANAPLNLDLTMGAQRKGLITNELVPATTFANAEQMLEALRERGVQNLQLTLRGWNRDGLYRATPNRMPADRRLGGNAGLTALTARARALGVPVYLLDDYEDALGGERGFFAHNDAMRGANKLPLFSNGVGTSNYIYLLNPIVEFNNFVKRDVPKEKQLGASGLDLLWFGSEVSYDTNELHPLSRQGYIDWNMKITDYIKQELGSVAVEGGNAYILGHAADARGVSVDSSHYQYEDEPVPFYELVMHGFVTYTGKYANLRSDPQFEFLREIEYGAQPSFNLTYLPTSDLNRALFTYDTWSSGWSDWLDDLVREYQDVTVQLGSTTDQAIVDHQQLGDGVYETTYANGVKVIVNYSSQRFAAGAVAVDPLSYAVVK